ncbi:DUF5777 family beta-barrel protein [Hymenobacter sp. BT175]|uniref:DUF5777 family beta-barrel protein n=1 Tax=Hymenobacter translucens TaxID=2886507 RepID=UPI001D0ECA91|nr:DUF5777 family beta-barrel protein [Hymenobacter translucens]MCC2546814.1 DUF5777 family beta-barrel protein [Hymenobacter translucens]
MLPLPQSASSWLRAAFLAAGLLFSSAAYAQDDLLADLDKQTVDSTRTDYTFATFKGTRVINAQSVETAGRGTMIFLISHRFGALNSGAYNFFGLDQAALRLGLEYGITDRVTVGIGRSSFQKTYDGFVKYKAVRQGTGPRAMPVTVTLLASSALNTLRYPDQERSFGNRLTYTYQALIARKFSPALSVQLAPTLIHRNLVSTRPEENDVYALGFAARQKLTKRVALTADYFYLLPGHTADNYRNSLALGFDIETGGHVFQLHFANAQEMIEPYFIPQTTGRWSKGDIYFGFNISRNFTVR